MVWVCALCVNPVEVNGWRPLGARRFRVAKGFGNQWRVLSSRQ